MISLPPANRKHIQASLAAASKWSMYAGAHFTDSKRMESRVNVSRKEGHPNTCIQPSTRLGIELGTSGLGDRDLNHCANPSARGRKELELARTPASCHG